jgi:hypothetical protein
MVGQQPLPDPLETVLEIGHPPEVVSLGADRRQVMPDGILNPLPAGIPPADNAWRPIETDTLQLFVERRLGRHQSATQTERRGRYSRCRRTS